MLNVDRSEIDMTTPMAVSHRRQFVRAALVTAVSYRRILGANDRIRIGAIGTGQRGQTLLGLLNRLGANEIVALCDVYKPHLATTRAAHAPNAQEYVDHRELLDRKDVDAVVIATPDHWHVPILMDALRAGKDIYCEKPVTHTLEEGEPLIAAVRESKRVVQIGLQQRSWEHFARARNEIVDGRLGQVTLIRTYWYQNHLSPGRPGNFDTDKLDWKRFLGSASERAFDADQFANWRWYWDFGGGAMTDLFVHWVDVAHWFMGVDMPERATANGLTAILAQRQTPDTMSAALAYPGHAMTEISRSLTQVVHEEEFSNPGLSERYRRNSERRSSAAASGGPPMCANQSAVDSGEPWYQRTVRHQLSALMRGRKTWTGNSHDNLPDQRMG